MRLREKIVKMRVCVASDHAGFDAKCEVLDILEQLNCVYEDFGPDNSQVSVDYPDYASKVCERVLGEGAGSFGILICGSGTGMQIAANKFKGIRAVFCFDEYSAKMARRDNDCNVLTLRAREFDHSSYYGIVKTFLETEFSGESRHKRRIDKLEK